jgi:hypothetical protein
MLNRVTARGEMCKCRDIVKVIEWIVMITNYITLMGCGFDHEKIKSKHFG